MHIERNTLFSSELYVTMSDWLCDLVFWLKEKNSLQWSESGQQTCFSLSNDIGVCLIFFSIHGTYNSFHLNLLQVNQYFIGQYGILDQRLWSEILKAKNGLNFTQQISAFAPPKHDFPCSFICRCGVSYAISAQTKNLLENLITQTV